MTLLLAGDVGGTKTILRLVRVADAAQDAAAVGASLLTLHEATYASRDYVDLVPMVREFLAAAGAVGALVSGDRPLRACFGIAGPVKQGVSRLTNLGWLLEDHRLAHALDLERVVLINDFAAIGYGIAALVPDDLYSLQAGQLQPTAPIAFLGAGTGLGEGYGLRVETAGRSQMAVFPSEGGHADFAPRSPLEWELVKYLRDKYGIDRVSVERVVSGAGVVALYQFLRDRSGNLAAPGVATSLPSPVEEAIRQWEREAGRSQKSLDPAAIISGAALDQSDPLCEQALALFVAAYGAEAGNLALKVLPFGGLYIAGGIAPKILPLLKSDLFMENFLSKGRMRDLLAAVPVSVVLNPQVGSIGAAVCAAQG